MILSLPCVEQKRQHPAREAVLGDHRWQSQESRLELGLRLRCGFLRANGLDCWRAPRWWKAAIRGTSRCSPCRIMPVRSHLTFSSWQADGNSPKLRVF